MKLKPYLKIVFLVFFVTPAIAQAQSWVTRRICMTPTRDSYDPKIAVSGDNVYIVWRELMKGKDDIFFSCSHNGGETWSLQQNISRSPEDSWSMDIAASGLNVYIVWLDSGLYFAQSNDGGTSWSNKMLISDSNYWSGWPSIDIYKNRIAVVWTGGIIDSDEVELYSRTSNDYGVHWNPIEQLTSASGYPRFAQITLKKNRCYLTWRDGHNIFFNRSIDSGKSWGSSVKLPTSSSSYGEPRLTVSDPYIYIAWNNDTKKCLYKSPNRGVFWTTESLDIYGGWYDIAAIGTDVYVIWEGSRGIIYLVSHDRGKSWEKPLTISKPNALPTRIIVDESYKVYIVYGQGVPYTVQGKADIFLKYTKD